MVFFRRLLFVLFSCIYFNVSAQTMCNEWYSKEFNVCFAINKDYTAQVNDFDRIKIKKKNNSFKLLWYNNQTIFGWQKDVYKFVIDKLTTDTLIISQLDEKNMFEPMGGKTILFNVATEGCSNKLKK